MSDTPWDITIYGPDANDPARLGGRAVGTPPGGSQPFDTVEITPGPEQLYGLLIQAMAGFRDVFNAYLRVLDEDGNEILNVDDGGFDMTSPAGQGSIHVRFTETDTAANSDLSSRGLALQGGDISFNISPDRGISMSVGVPADIPSTGFVQMYYDDTPGSAKVRFRGKDDDGVAVSGSVNLT